MRRGLHWCLRRVGKSRATTVGLAISICTTVKLQQPAGLLYTLYMFSVSSELSYAPFTKSFLHENVAE